MVGVPSSCVLLGDLQLVHMFRCYDNIASNANYTRSCLVVISALNSVEFFDTVGWQEQRRPACKNTQNHIYPSISFLSEKNCGEQKMKGATG